VRSTSLARRAVEETAAGRQFTIRAAPLRHPRVNPEEPEVAPGEIGAYFPQETALDRSQSVPWDPDRDRDMTDSSAAAGLTTSRGEGVPPNQIFAAINDVRLQSNKRISERLRIAEGPRPASFRAVPAQAFASWSLPLTTSGAALVGPACRKAGIVTVMNKGTAPKLVALEHGPSASADAVPSSDPSKENSTTGRPSRWTTR
jgi:hypothetical protein